MLNIDGAIVKGQKEWMICRKERIIFRKDKEVTSGLRGINKWKKEEQQVENSGELLEKG